MEVILDFCAKCGNLLYEGQGLEENPHCANCAAEVKSRSARCQGIFSREDAEKFKRAYDV
jgi:hypothetical protein